MSLLKVRFYASIETYGFITDFDEYRDFYNVSGLSADADWIGLLGGHWHHPLRAPSFDQAIYLLRDGLDVIYSVWRFEHKRGGTNMSLGDHLRERRPAIGGQTNPVPAGLSIASRWHWSTQLWKVSGIPIVRYEDLLDNADRELGWIGDHYGLEEDRTLETRNIPVGYFPSQKPGKGKGRKVYEPADIEYFEVEAKQEADHVLSQDAWYQSQREADSQKA